MRQVRQIMGLPISIDIPAAKSLADFEPAFKILREIDEQFSTYKPDSEVSRYARGELKNPSPKLAKVIKECKKYEAETDGYFSAWAGGAFDPSGYVKGWAIDEAGKLIQKAGFGTFCIGAGGDILARSDGSKIWNIGIQDPQDNTKILDLSSNFVGEDLPAPHQNLSGAISNRIVKHQVFGAGLSISNGAVATSGNYERGQHIINPKTRRSANDLLSVTVIGPSIITADVLATAVFAMGKSGFGFIETTSGYEALLIDRAQKYNATPEFNLSVTPEPKL